MAETLLAVLLTVHLLLVDVAMAGPLACVALAWNTAGHDEVLAARAGRALAGLSIAALVAGTLAGGLLLALRWWLDDRAYLSALGAVPASRLWFGGAEMVFSLAAIAAYRALWNRRRRLRWAHPLLALAGGTNLLAHFPALFVIVAVLAQRGTPGDGPLSGAEYRALLVDGEVVARVIHVWLAAALVTAVFTIVIIRWLAVDSDRDARDALVRRWGLVAFTAVALQLPSGFFVAWQMPEVAQRLVFGGDPLAAGLLIGSLMLAFGLLHVLSAVALGDRDEKHLRRTLVMLPLLMLCMVATRVHVYNRMRTDVRAEVPLSTVTLVKRSTR